MTGDTMFERFTPCARRAMARAREEAQRLKHSSIGTEHILLGLTGDPESVAGDVLDEFGIGSQDTLKAIEEVAPAREEETPQDHLPLTAHAKTMLEICVEGAEEFHHDFIGTAHLLLALLREEEGKAGRILRDVFKLKKTEVRIVVGRRVP
jgi:ATP-dependent Clp protease ATP-binding subunit ClpC